MADVPIYSSRAAAPNIGSLSIQPVQVPDLHTGEGLSEGAIALGQALSRYAAFKKNADDTTRTNTAMTGFITGMDAAETQAAQDPNWETAPQDFHKKAEELSQKALDAAKLDPADRSALELRLRTISLASGRTVTTAALGKQVDAAAAARGSQALYLSRAAVDATSDVESQAMIEQQISTIKKNVAAGLLAADKGEAEIQAFQKSVSDGRIRQLIRTNPFEAEKQLKDPSKFPGVSGSEIEVYRASAQTAGDQARKDGLITLATGSHPEQASMQVNKALSRRDAAAIFDGGIIHIEHGATPAYLGPGTAGGGGLRSAPAGTKPVAPGSPGTAPVRTAGGRVFWVDARFQKNFQGFISDYEAHGGVIGPNSNTLGERPNNGSYHPIGAAIDINQTGRGIRGGGVTLPTAVEDQLAAKWGLRSGNHFRDNDNGHFDAGGSGGGDGGILPGSTFDTAKAALEVSEAGAIGLAQIMPGTAREVAAKLALLDPAGKPVAQMSDAEITSYLRQNPDVNHRLGQEYWFESLDAFDQNVALAAAGYNAGIGRAREYQAAITAKYGADATPLQIAEYIRSTGNTQTADYILKLFGSMNIPPTGAGLTPGARVPTMAALETEIASQQAAAARAANELAALGRVSGSETLDAMKKGYTAWTPEFEKVVEQNVIAANNGSVEASSFLRDVKAYQEAKPSTDQAYTMPPPRLDNEISRLDAKASAGMATHAELVQLQAYQAVQKQIGESYKTDPVGLGDRAGFYKVQDLDINANPSDPRFLQSLAVRGLQAVQAEKVYNSLAPLRPPEVAGLKQRLADGSVEEKFGLLRAMATALDPRVYKAAIDQLGLPPATAIAGHFALEQPELAKKILYGQSTLAVPGAAPAAAAIQTAAAAEISGLSLYPKGSRALADVMAAVSAVYAANRGDAGILSEKKVDDATIEKSVEEVTGPLVKVAAHQVAAPFWSTADGFTHMWENISDEDVANFGGAFDAAGHPIDAQSLAEHGVLSQLEPGGSEYVVSTGDGAGIFKKNGELLVIDFRQLNTAQRLRAGAELRKQPIGPTVKEVTTPMPAIGLGFGSEAPMMEMPPMPPEAAPAPEELPQSYLDVLKTTPETARRVWEKMTPQQQAPYREGRSLIPSLTTGVPGEGR